MTDFKATATSTVLGGMFIPAHDETFDLAEVIGTKLEEFRAYVASVRTEGQADHAVAELLTALAPKQDHTFRVTHERTGEVAYQGTSYREAGSIQYGNNKAAQMDGEQPFWRMWLVDEDGASCIVNTQQPTR